MINLLVAVLLMLCSNSTNVEFYKVVNVSNNAHVVTVEDTKCNVFEYYQEEQTALCIGDQVIDIQGELIQCEDNNSYDVASGEYLVIDVNCNTYMVTHDYIVTINEYK